MLSDSEVQAVLKATSPASPAQLYGRAVPGMVRQYHLSEVTSPEYYLTHLSMVGGTPDEEAQARRGLQEAFALRSREESQDFTFYIRVLPDVGGGRRILFETQGTDLPMQSIRLVKPDGFTSLSFQTEKKDLEELAKVQQFYGDLAGIHADLIANVDVGSFGGEGATLTAGTRLKREKTLKPSNPAGGGLQEVQPFRVEQQLHFTGVQDGLLELSRSSRILETQQRVEGNAELTTALREYVWTGELSVQPDGLPVQATRLERAVMESRISTPLNAAGEGLNFTVLVVAASQLTLTFLNEFTTEEAEYELLSVPTNRQPFDG